jgi:LEA14-like dessication related protein
MFKQSTLQHRRETQTGSSAFFCLPATFRIEWIAAIVVLVMIGVSTTHGQSLEGQKPQVRLNGLSFKSIDLRNGTAQTELSILVDNPGPAFKLKDLSYRLKLNDKQAAEGKYAREIEIPDHASKTVELPCALDLSAVPGVAWSVISEGFDVHYQLDTEFTVPLFPPLSPRIKTSINGDLSLTETVSGWSARIKERISGN